MIIWQGSGILVILSALIGVASTPFLLKYSGTEDQAMIGAIRMGGGAAVAFIFNWLLCKFLYRGGDRVLVDPASGRNVKFSPSHSLFFIPAKWFTVLFALAIPALAYVGWQHGTARKADMAQYPGLKPFEAADDKIDSGEKNHAHGSNPTAEIAALACAKTCSELQPQMFKRSGRKPILGDGVFRVYCLQTKEGALFLVHVPELKSYQDADAKQAIAELVWAAAQTATADSLKLPKTAAVGIGLRDSVSRYGSVWLGRAEGDPMLTDSESGAVKRLYAWFSPDRALAASSIPPK